MSSVGLALASRGLAAALSVAESPSANTAATTFKDLRAAAPETPLSQRLISVAGVGVMIGLCWLLSRNRRAILWRPIAWGVAMQLVIGLIVLSPTLGDALFDAINSGVGRLMAFSQEGADFVFQSIAAHEVTEVDLATGEKVTRTIIGHISPALKTVAFWILPSIIFFSSLMAVLYHLGVMQPIVRGMSAIMQRTMKASGAESLSTAANVFLGQTEAPLVVRPFIDGMTRSELFTIMVGGFATVAGGVLAAYVGFLQQSLPDVAGHLVIASIMAAPATLVVAKLMVPETGHPATAGASAETDAATQKLDTNVVEAVSRGASEGMTLFLNVVAMLIAFVAMVALVNWGIAWLGGLAGLDLSLEKILGWVFAPLAFCMGIPWGECLEAGRLLGEKTVLTELIAYMHLGELMQTPGALSYRSAVIMSYALCGFANFASIGIQIGGIGGLAPGRRKDLAELGVMAMVGGTITTLMLGAIAGILI